MKTCTILTPIKIALLAAMVTAALCLCGCADKQEPAQEEPEKPEILPLEIDHGYSQEGNTVNLGVRITNPNDSVAFENASVSYMAQDKDGKVVASDNEYKVGTVLPGETFVFGIGLSPANKAEVTELKVSIDADEPIESSDISNVAIDRNSITEAHDSTYVTANGSYTNKTELEHDSIMVGMLMLDDEGNILGGGLDDQFEPKQGERSFSIICSYPENAKAPASYEYSAHVYKM